MTIIWSGPDYSDNDKNLVIDGIDTIDGVDGMLLWDVTCVGMSRLNVLATF